MDNNQVTLNLCVIKGNTNNICCGSLLIQRGCPVAVPCEPTTCRMEPLHRLLVDLLTKRSCLLLHTDTLILYSLRWGEDVRMTGLTSSESVTPTKLHAHLVPTSRFAYETTSKHETRTPTERGARLGAQGPHLPGWEL